MPQTTHPNASILIIDDEPQIRKFLDIALRAQGYQVESLAIIDRLDNCKITFKE